MVVGNGRAFVAIALMALVPVAVGLLAFYGDDWFEEHPPALSSTTETPPLPYAPCPLLFSD